MSKVGSKPGESSALRLFRAGKAIAPTLGKLARTSIARTPTGDGPGAPQGLAPRVSTAPGTPRPLNRENLPKLGRLRLAVHDIRAEMNAATPVVGPHQRRSRVLIDAISVELKKHPRFDKYGKHVDRFPAQALELWDAAKGLKASLKDIKGPLKEMKAGFMEALREDWTFAQTPAKSEADTAVHTPEPETPTSDTFTAGSEDDITPESKLDIHIDIEPDADATSTTGSTIDFADVEKPPLTPVSTGAAQRAPAPGHFEEVRPRHRALGPGASGRVPEIAGGAAHRRPLLRPHGLHDEEEQVGRGDLRRTDAAMHPPGRRPGKRRFRDGGACAGRRPGARKKSRSGDALRVVRKRGVPHRPARSCPPRRVHPQIRSHPGQHGGVQAQPADVRPAAVFPFDDAG